MISPLHPHVGFVLKSRPHSMISAFTQQQVFVYFTVEKLTNVMDLAIETEVQMEIMR